MAGRLTDGAISRAAQRLGCEVAAIRAVIDVESAGSGFLGDGRPKVLFEAHVFSRETGGQFDHTHPTLSTRHWQRDLYKGGAAEYLRVYRAAQLNGEAAMRACSWGMFQIMGFNFAECGERSLHGFLLAMHNNEDAQLALFSGLIESKSLAASLRGRDWAKFARVYNGQSYARNQYDTKLAAAYARHTEKA